MNISAASPLDQAFTDSVTVKVMDRVDRIGLGEFVVMLDDAKGEIERTMILRVMVAQAIEDVAGLVLHVYAASFQKSQREKSIVLLALAREAALKALGVAPPP